MSNKGWAQGEQPWSSQVGIGLSRHLLEAVLIQRLLAAAAWPSVLASGLCPGLQGLALPFKPQSPSRFYRRASLTSHLARSSTLLRISKHRLVHSEWSHLCVFATRSCHQQGPAQVSPSRNVTTGLRVMVLFPNTAVPCPSAVRLQALRGWKMRLSRP